LLVLFFRLVQFNRIILVAVGFDIRNLENGFLRDLKVRGEVGLARLAILPRFCFAHVFFVLTQAM
jgi:hypothetical protein